MVYIVPPPFLSSQESGGVGKDVSLDAKLDQRYLESFIVECGFEPCLSGTLGNSILNMHKEELEDKEDISKTIWGMAKNSTAPPLPVSHLHWMRNLPE